MLECAVIRFTADVTQNVRTFEVVSRHREFLVKIYAIHKGNFDIRGRQGQEPRKHSVELLHDVFANLPGFGLVEDCRFSVAGAKKTSIRQREIIRPHRQAANVTLVGTTGTCIAKKNFIMSDFVRGGVNGGGITKHAATNGAVIGIRPRRRDTTKQERQNESWKQSRLVPHECLSEVTRGGLSLNKIQRAGFPAR
jgi:hypothetical protein